MYINRLFISWSTIALGNKKVLRFFIIYGKVEIDLLNIIIIFFIRRFLEEVNVIRGISFNTGITYIIYTIYNSKGIGRNKKKYYVIDQL